MSTATIFIVAAVFLAGLALGAFILWLLLRRHKMSATAEKSPAMAQPKPVNETLKTQTDQPSPFVFRFSYVIAPLIMAIVCLIIASAFVSFLPSSLGFRFAGGGTVQTSMNKYTFIALMIAAQIICALVAWTIAWTIIRMGRSAFKTSQPQIPPNGYISLMSNMILLPQMILAYIMLDAFIYGTWTRHLISVGLFSILTIAIGSLILIFMFVRMLSRAQNVISKQ